MHEQENWCFQIQFKWTAYSENGIKFLVTRLQEIFTASHKVHIASSHAPLPAEEPVPVVFA